MSNGTNNETRDDGGTKHPINVVPTRPKVPRPDATTPVEKGTPNGDATSNVLSNESGTGKLPRSPIEKGVEKGQESGRKGDTLSDKDRDLLAWVVLLRFASYRQLQHLQGNERHPSLLRRRLANLVGRGFLTTWDRPGRSHRGQRYALPTATCLRVLLPFLRTAIAREPFAPLVRLMLPAERRALSLDDDGVEKWLPHQLEVNELVTRVRLARPSIAWASTWEAPLPTTVGFVLAPQPDYVLIERASGDETIVFGEHDRGTGDIAAFVARKIALYDALAQYPDLCAEHFGLATFRVDVTVIDTAHHDPMKRLRAMIDAASSSMHPERFRFTLGGWLYAYTDEKIWFSAERLPVTNSLHWPDHRTPVSA